jgi:hypothetical protein
LPFFGQQVKHQRCVRLPSKRIQTLAKRYLLYLVTNAKIVTRAVADRVTVNFKALRDAGVSDSRDAAVQESSGDNASVCRQQDVAAVKTEPVGDSRQVTILPKVINIGLCTDISNNKGLLHVCSI